MLSFKPAFSLPSFTFMKRLFSSSSLSAIRMVSPAYLKSESESCSVVSDSLRFHGQYGSWSSPCQITGVGSLFLLQGIYPTQGLNPGLLHCRWILYHLSYQGSPAYLRQLISLLAILIPACASSSPAFHMMYSTPLQYSCLENPTDGGAW